MELKLKPARHNAFPLSAFLIKGGNAKEWLLELQVLGFSLNEVELFPVPGTEINSVWACLVIVNEDLRNDQVGKNELCQEVFSNLFIPEKSILVPEIMETDRAYLFTKNIHLFHPEVGVAELENSLDLSILISKPIEALIKISQASNSVFIPKSIQTFQIKALESEEVLDKLERLDDSAKGTIDKPLNFTEKARLTFYKGFFKTFMNQKSQLNVEKKGLGKALEQVESFISENPNNWSKKMLNDFKDLARRNQKEVDKLMALLKNNPEEALKYAIPLDESGASRGTDFGEFNLSKRWSNFSLFGSGGFSSGGSGSFDLGDQFYELRRQYEQTALEFIKQKKYEKAAFIYLKLLKNDLKAAQILEEGGLYQEAASIYLDRLKNKEKAAECYEKGKSFDKAIDLYKELGRFEKVGDLYFLMKNKKEAFFYYEKRVDQLKSKKKYFLATKIYQDKIHNLSKTQSLCLEAWDKNIDAYACLNLYFSSFDTDSQELKEKIDTIYSSRVHLDNRKDFLKIARSEFRRNKKLRESIRDIGYEIISTESISNKGILDELRAFNSENSEVSDDVSSFRRNSRR